MHYLILYSELGHNEVKHMICWGETQQAAVYAFSQERDLHHHVDILTVTPHNWEF